MEKKTKNEKIRIAKLISNSGLTSRREAEKLILEKRVTLYGEVIDSPALNVDRNAIVTVETHLFSKKRSSEKYNIFGTVSCPKCNGDVRRLEINKRRAFVCDKCQPLPEHVS